MFTTRELTKCELERNLVGEEKQSNFCFKCTSLILPEERDANFVAWNEFF